MTRVSIALPVANQEDHIERVVTAYLDATTGLDCDVEFILAVNNSTDDSLGASRRLAAAHPRRIAVVTTAPGWGSAVRGGLEIAGGQVVGFANSARTHAEDLVRAIRHAVAEPGLLVKGRRVNRAYPLARRVGSKLFNLECRLLFGLRVADVNGNPKVWHRDRLSPAVLREPGSFLDAEVLICARQRGLPVVEFPITRMDRHGGRSMTDLRLASTLYTRPLSARLGRAPRRDPGAVVVTAPEAL